MDDKKNHFREAVEESLEGANIPEIVDTLKDFFGWNLPDESSTIELEEGSTVELPAGLPLLGDGE